MHLLFNIVVGFAIDIAATLIKGSAFYIVWAIALAAVVPMGMELSWTLAVIIVFVTSFLIRQNNDIPNIPPCEFWGYCMETLWKTIARCIAFVLVAFLLAFIL